MSGATISNTLTDFYLKKLKTVKALVFDFDGVFTNGNIYVSDDGSFFRSTNVKDGYAINKAVKLGYPIAVISGGSSEGVVRRLNRLGVDDVFIQVKDKVKVLHSWLEKNNLQASECLVMGDDVPDAKILKMVGFSCSPADAVAEIRSFVDFVSSKNGGEGCVREVVEAKLRLDGHW
ncbi:MAG: HAD-IIIA family hydrolase [Bacteroidia bacterium]|nr:HAD-IIIA family hydrolase [Bacteroidia bacterium]